MNAFSYFPGCSLHATAREYDESIRAVAGALGLELREIEDWCCCGATPAHAIDPRAAHVLGLWNLAQASKAGTGRVLTGCASCFARLRATREELRAAPPGEAELPVDPGLEVLHIIQALAAPEIRERLQAAVVRPLTGVRVACYYGCLLTRPGGAGAVDDTEDPRLMEELVEAAGATAVDWPLRLDCCGASMALPRVDIVHDLAGRILSMAHERGAALLVVACPMCHSNLDLQQAAALKKLGARFRLPVVYLTQLIGLALGIAPARLGLQRHFVAVPPIESLSTAEGESRV